MMNKVIYTTIAIIMITITLATATQATITDNIINDYSFDNAYTTGTTSIDTINVNNGTIDGATTGITGKVLQAYNFTANGNDVSNTQNYYTGNDTTIALWVNPNATGVTQYVLNTRTDSNRMTIIWFPNTSPYNGFGCLFNGASHGRMSSPPSIDTWHFVVCRKNATSVDLWVDNVKQTSGVPGTGSTQAGIYIGTENGTTSSFTGGIDQVTIWNRSLSDTEINTTLWNYGIGVAYPYTGLIPNFSITATDQFNGSSINITAIIDGITTYTNNTISTDLLQNSTSLHNITIMATNYFNITYNNYNVSSNLAATLHQAEVCFNASSKISGSYITPNNFTIGSTSRTNCFNITAATHNVQAQKTGWYNKNQTFTIAALSNTTQTLENMSYANLTVYVKDEHTGSYLSLYNINLVSENYTGWIGENYTGVSNKSYSLINGTYNVTVFKSGYATTNATKDVTVAGNTNYTFYLREENTLNITVYNETSNTLDNNSTITIDIIQSTITSNYTTSNGTLYVTNLTPGSIEIRYDDTGDRYRGRTYFLTLTNAAYQEIRLYLLDTTMGSLITFDLVDQDGQDLENATVKAQRFYPAENIYRTVAMTKSNFNGQGSIDLVKKATQANVFYKFIVEYNGATKQETTATEINPTGADILYFTIDVLQDIFTSWDGMENVEYNLTNGSWGDGTPYFSFVWTDTTGLTQYGCLKVSEHTPITESMKCNKCTTSTSATIVCNLTNNGHWYKASALIETTTNHSLYTVAIDDWNFDNNAATFGTYGVFLAFLFIGTMAAIGLWNPIVSVVTTLVALIFSVILGMISMTYVTVVSLVIVGGIIIAKSRT